MPRWRAMPERGWPVTPTATSAPSLEALVGCGFRIGELAVFLASRPFGRPELYLHSGLILH